MRRVHQQHRLLLSLFTATVVLLLALKYFWSLYLFPEVPFGYDAGIYRFLFIRHAAGLPPFHTAELPPWAMAHAPGLFFFTSILTYLGLSADALIGWMWNLFPVILACVLGLVVRRRQGNLAGFFTLVAALLSTVQYEGFLMMYQKTFVALLFCILAFSAFDEDSILWVPLGMLTVAIHQQIGLIFIVAVGSAITSSLVLKQHTISLRKVGEFLTTVILGLLWYLPTYERSLQDILPQLLASGTLAALVIAIVVVGGFSALVILLPRKNKRLLWLLSAVVCAVLLSLLPVVLDSPGIFSHILRPHRETVAGAFLSMTEYLRSSFPLLLAGITGLVLSLEKKRSTPFHWAALWCAIAALGMFFFYKRFLLPFDFFLLPCAGLAFAALWKQHAAGRIVLVLLIGAQAALLLHRASSIDPIVTPVMITEFASLHEHVPAGSTVVVMDNMTPWVLGYLPDASVSGPGIFDSLPLQDWEQLLLGSDADRTAFFEKYARGTFFYATDVFRTVYSSEVLSVLEHPCLQQTPATGLYQSSCGARGPALP